MVQIKPSVTFFLVAAAIAPVVALPVSDIGLSRRADEFTELQTSVFMSICSMIYVTSNP
jgi:hypothetical protein